MRKCQHLKRTTFHRPLDRREFIWASRRNCAGTIFYPVQQHAVVIHSFIKAHINSSGNIWCTIPAYLSHSGFDDYVEKFHIKVLSGRQKIVLLFCLLGYLYMPRCSDTPDTHNRPAAPRTLSRTRSLSQQFKVARLLIKVVAWLGCLC